MGFIMEQKIFNFEGSRKKHGQQFSGQNKAIWDHLLLGNWIWQDKAERLFGCKRLASRISDIVKIIEKHELKYAIGRERVKLLDRFGEPSLCKRYRLIKLEAK